MFFERLNSIETWQAMREISASLLYLCDTKDQNTVKSQMSTVDQTHMHAILSALSDRLNILEKSLGPTMSFDHVDLSDGPVIRAQEDTMHDDLHHVVTRKRNRFKCMFAEGEAPPLLWTDDLKSPNGQYTTPRR